MELGSNWLVVGDRAQVRPTLCQTNVGNPQEHVGHPQEIIGNILRFFVFFFFSSFIFVVVLFMVFVSGICCPNLGKL